MGFSRSRMGTFWFRNSIQRLALGRTRISRVRSFGAAFSLRGVGLNLWQCGYRIGGFAPLTGYRRGRESTLEQRTKFVGNIDFVVTLWEIGEWNSARNGHGESARESGRRVFFLWSAAGSWPRGMEASRGVNRSFRILNGFHRKQFRLSLFLWELSFNRDNNLFQSSVLSRDKNISRLVNDPRVCEPGAMG